jgi:CRISPR-associated exonuclease Cas4
MNDLTLFTGTEVGYYLVCKKKLWWFAHGVLMEQESDRVALGRVVHESAYARERKELEIDNKIMLDWREDGVIHEVKLTDRMEEAHEAQLLYYLFYLKCKGVEGLKGRLDYPKLKRTKEVELTKENEEKLINALREMRVIVNGDRPPSVEFMKICRSCSYAELCWG